VTSSQNKFYFGFAESSLNQHLDLLNYQKKVCAVLSQIVLLRGMLQRVVFHSALSQVSIHQFIGQQMERRGPLKDWICFPTSFPNFIYTFRYVFKKVFLYDLCFITDSWDEVVPLPCSASVH
jgi:hypothetical protein